ncbi:MAG: hypothetical protein OXE17_06050 [Chloroflexi bacterium]|nr:hypothetical protein [Chloroflexota bacterium]
MNTTFYNELQFGSVITSFNELRAIFPAGGYFNLLMLPHGAVPGNDWPFPQSELWQPPCSWDDIHPLLEDMIQENDWQAFETGQKKDLLRDHCLVHHFHLEAKRSKGPRSAYRWFAFRDPKRFGNVWFNLGGTYLSPSPEKLGQMWTSPTWMSRIIELYPLVARTYLIRGTPIPIPEPTRRGVIHIWENEKDCYPVVKVGNYIYLCAGGRAAEIDLTGPARRDR